MIIMSRQSSSKRSSSFINNYSFLTFSSTSCDFLLFNNRNKNQTHPKQQDHNHNTREQHLFSNSSCMKQQQELKEPQNTNFSHSSSSCHKKRFGQEEQKSMWSSSSHVSSSLTSSLLILFCLTIGIHVANCAAPVTPEAIRSGSSSSSSSGTTPAPFSPPEPAFECEDEGFFVNPKDCRKYFWCLDSGPANLGIVAHAFTCPSGLYFNPNTEACDYPSNVACKNKPKNTDDSDTRRGSNNRRIRKKKTTTTTTTESPEIIEDESITTTTTPPKVTTTTVTSPVSNANITPELLAAALRLNEERNQKNNQKLKGGDGTSSSSQSVSTSTSTSSSMSGDNLHQLLALVQSLGGVERIKTLAANSPKSDHNANDNNIVHNHHQPHPSHSGESFESSAVSETDNQPVVRINSRVTTQSPNFFNPTYETPKNRPTSNTFSRVRLSQISKSENNNQNDVILSETTTTNPLTQGLSSSDSRSVRHRRPQFSEPATTTVTINPFAAYADPLRTSPIVTEQPPVPPAPSSLSSFNNNDNNLNNNNPQNSFSFTYNTPGNRQTTSITQVNHAPTSTSGGVHHLSSPLLHPAEVNDQPGLNRHQVSNHHNSNHHSSNSNPIFSDPFFSYNSPPDRFAQSSTKQEATVTEPTSNFHVTSSNSNNNFNNNNNLRDHEPFTHDINNNNRHDNHVVRIRLPPPNSQSGFRGIIPDTHGSGRRATRVRVSNFNHMTATHNHNHQSLPEIRTANHPGVLYDDSVTENPLHSSYSDPQPFLALTTRKPRRKRPPQRPHLRNRPEENPVSALINLPPPNLLVEPLHPQHQPQHAPRPLPPRPHSPPPRILPIAVPLGIPTPPPNTNNLNNNNHRAIQSFSHPNILSNPNLFIQTTTPAPIRVSSESGFGPNTVRFSNLLPGNKNQQSFPQTPRLPHEERDIFVTDFPFYDLNPQTNPPVFITTTQPPPTTTQEVTTHRHFSTSSSTSTSFSSNRQQRGRNSNQSNRRQPVPLPSHVPVATTTRAPRQPPTSAPAEIRHPSDEHEPSGPPVAMDNTGGVSCVRRGVFAHPASCGQFVVCAPVSRGSSSYRPYTHHCPAEQVFVEEVGRCRPGNKERCEVFT